jgi:hypothetical protein
MSWFNGSLAVVSVALGAIRLIRLARARRDGHSAGVEVAHVAMCFGMAAMFAPSASPVPHSAWIGFFTIAAAWFAVPAFRSGLAGQEPGHHLVCSIAMLVMLTAGVDQPTTVTTGSGGGHPDHGMGTTAVVPALAVSLVALVLAGYFACHILRCGQDRPELRITGRLRASTATVAGIVEASVMTVMVLGMV